MEQNLIALQGKIFTVDLQSMMGSTNYGWCLTTMPSTLILMATETIPSNNMGPVIQRFYFGAVSSQPIESDIHFAMICWSDLTQIIGSHTVHLRIVPSENANFMPYSENAGNTCGYTPGLKYGFPCEQAAMANGTMLYGYPSCPTQYVQNTSYNGITPQTNTPIIPPKPRTTYGFPFKF